MPPLTSCNSLSDLRFDEASSLHNQIEIGSSAFDALLRALNAHVIDEAYFFAGTALKNFR
ncbi:MAG: hypothetical protein QM744_00685 [Mesorhizobium sp.]